MRIQVGNKLLMFLLSILFLLLSGVAYAIFNYTAGQSLGYGQFRSDGTGNAGDVNMHGSSLVGNQLQGDIFIQTVGTGTFKNATIIPPSSGNATRTCWTVNGTIDSKNAGDIYLADVFQARVRFNPVSQKLEGYGYTPNLGKVPLGQGTSCMDDNVVSDADVIAIQNGTDTGGNTIADTSAGFIGRVKVIGNAGGNTIFDTLYSQGEKFNASIFNATLQRIRKNVTLFTRNLFIPTSGIQVGDKLLYTGNQSLTETLLTRFSDSSVRTLIIIGGDLTINTEDILSFSAPKGIIVLKDQNGVGGNIYISSFVRRIYAAIFAEGSLYSGESSNLENDTATDLTNLPEKQLYIYGSLTSRNTIGGASKSATDVVCPYNTTCTLEDATRYDLNYFRDYDKTSGNRAYEDDSLNDYSFIIKYDSRLFSNPPPGFE